MHRLIRHLLPLAALCAPGCASLEQDGQRATPTAATPITFHVNEAFRDSGYPFSSAVETDGWVFLSGAIGTGPDRRLVAGGIENETRQTLTNIRQTLAARGLGMERIVKCTAMLADMDEWPAFNGVYKTFFNGNYPARSAFGASGLALDARIELECIARR